MKKAFLLILWMILLVSLSFAATKTTSGSYPTTYDPDDFVRKLDLNETSDGSLEVRFAGFGNKERLGLLSGKLKVVNKDPFEVEIRDGQFESRNKFGSLIFSLKDKFMVLKKSGSGKNAVMNLTLFTKENKQVLVNVSHGKLITNVWKKKGSKPALVVEYFADIFNPATSAGAYLKIPSYIIANLSNDIQSIILNNVAISRTAISKEDTVDSFIFGKFKPLSAYGMFNTIRFEGKSEVSYFSEESEERMQLTSPGAEILSMGNPKIKAVNEPYYSTADNTLSLRDMPIKLIRPSKNIISVYFKSGNKNYDFSGKNTIVYYKGRKLLSLNKGGLFFTEKKAEYEDCAKKKATLSFVQSSSCVLLSGNKIKIKPLSPLSMDLLSNNMLIEIDPLNPRILGHFEIFIVDGKSKRKLKIVSKKLEVMDAFGNKTNTSEDWVNFKNSFITEIYRNKEYNTLSCYHKDWLGKKRGCYYNDQKFTGLNPKKCKKDSDCSSKEFCNFEKCTKKSECSKHFINANKKGSWNIILVGTYPENFKNIPYSRGSLMNKFEGDINDLLFGNFGLFTISPFDKYFEKFNIYYVNAGTQTLFVGPDYERMVGYATSCKKYSIDFKKSYIMLLSNQKFRASALVLGEDDDWAGIASTDAPGMKITKDVRLTLVHEFGHSFGKLSDEYIEIIPNGARENYFFNQYPNCPITKRQAKSWWKDKMGLLPILVDSSLSWTKFSNIGCGGKCTVRNRNKCELAIRPSRNSVMFNHRILGGDSFNAPSSYTLTAKLRKG